MDTAISHIEFEAIIVDTVTPGTKIELDFALSGSGGYNKTVTLTVQVGEKPRKGFYSHRNGNLRFTVSNFGQYGFSYGSFNPLGYDGFKYLDSTSNELFEAAFLIGTDSNHVSDGARTVADEPDNDFSVAPGGDMIIHTPGAVADQETFSIFNDSRAENPIGVEITQKSYNWDEPPDDNFIILQYVIRNMADTAINNIYAGLFFDWNLNPTWYDAAGYDSANNLGYIYHDSIGVPYYIAAKYRGITVLNEEGVVTHKLHATNPSLPNYSLTEAEKYQFLSDSVFESYSYTHYNQAHVLSTGPFNLMPGQIDTALFAIVAADSSLSNLIAAAAGAKTKFQSATDVFSGEEGILPEDFTLNQNYPNPFNPTTTISFRLKSRSEVTLSIYNILGEKVVDLLRRDFPAGTYEIIWNGRDKENGEVASGLYFYRLTASGQSLTKKMILLK
jgi:hypothetical protein